MLMKSIRFLLLIAYVFIATSASAQQSEKILIAAASDLKFALDSIITVFNQKNRGEVQVSYGSSGKLYHQISNGAPFDIFFSADISYPNLLKENGFTSSDVYPYGIGRIVLWSKRLNPEKEEMKALLDPAVRKVAIANPAHAPYGKRAEEALIHFGLYESVKGKFVFGENISQTAQFVTTGAADIGIVALSLAVSPTMKRQAGNYFLIPESSHETLLQGAVITKRAQDSALAERFMDFIKGEIAGNILQEFGFTKPE